jgi:hypothetical protein
VDGDVRASGGGRGKYMIVASSSDSPTLSDSSSNSSTVTSGLDGRFCPRGMAKYLGDPGPCEGPLGVKKRAFG